MDSFCNGRHFAPEYMPLIECNHVAVNRHPVSFPTTGVNMAIDVSKLSEKQLKDRIRKAKGRMHNIDKEKTAKVKTKVNALLKAEGVTFAQVYGRKRGGKTGKVPPKYRNPNGAETWSGRGKRPRWYLAALKSGKKEKDLLIK
jgi:DNA-binding protein H-NS